MSPPLDPSPPVVVGGSKLRPEAGAAALSWAGVAYLMLCLWVALNPVFVSSGWPLPHVANLMEGAQQGARGLGLLAISGVFVIVVATVTGAVTRQQWPLLLALGGWMVGPALSLAFLGSLQDGRYWAVAVSALAVGFAATIVGARHLSRLLWLLGWVFGWGSVVAGASQIILSWPEVLIAGDSRHVEWLSRIGIRVESVMILNGLSPGRLFLSMTCGLLLVLLLRQQRPSPGRWARATVLAGLILAMAWSGGRVGLIAAVIGALAAMIPWQQWPAWVAFAVALAIPTLPLVVSQFMSSAENSAQWRFDLWKSYFVQPDLWFPFALGPQAPTTPIRGHAHNQILESLAAGGWIGLLGLLAFLYLGLLAARHADDNRLAYGVVFAMCGIFAFDVVTFAPTSMELNSAFVIAIAVIVNAAGTPSPPHPRLLDQTPHAIDR